MSEQLRTLTQCCNFNGTNDKYIVFPSLLSADAGDMVLDISIRYSIFEHCYQIIEATSQKNAYSITHIDECVCRIPPYIKIAPVPILYIYIIIDMRCEAEPLGPLYHFWELKSQFDQI